MNFYIYEGRLHPGPVASSLQGRCRPVLRCAAPILCSLCCKFWNANGGTDTLNNGQPVWPQSQWSSCCFRLFLVQIKSILQRKKCIISSAAFFHAKFQIRNNSRARYVNVYSQPLCVRFNDQNSKEIENETSPTGKKNTWEKDTLYVCQWYHIHLTWVSVLLHEYLRQREGGQRKTWILTDTLTHSSANIFTSVNFASVSSSSSSSSLTFFSVCQSNAFHSVTLPLTLKQGCSLGDGGFMGGAGGRGCGWNGGYFWTPASLR